MITTMRRVMIIPASMTHRAVGSNPSLDPKRSLETQKLALLTAGRVDGVGSRAGLEWGLMTDTCQAVVLVERAVD